MRWKDGEAATPLLRMTFLLMPYCRLFVPFHSFSIQVILLAYPELTVNKILKSFSHELLAHWVYPMGTYLDEVYFLTCFVTYR